MMAKAEDADMTEMMTSSSEKSKRTGELYDALEATRV